MSRKLKSTTNDWGVTTEYHAEDGNFIVQLKQDSTPILEHNKARQNAISSKAIRRYPGDIESVANITFEVYEHWRTVEGVDILKLDEKELDKFLRQKLNSDCQFLKTVPWQV